MKKTYKPIIFLVAFLSLHSCLFQKNQNTFRVLLDALPQKIDPRKNEINIYHYINLQMYFPLLEKKGAGELSSKFLDIGKTISLDRKFKNYKLCLKGDLFFSDSTPVLVNDLVQSLIDTGAERKDLLINKVSKLGDRCVRVKLNKNDPYFLDKLVSVDTTILKTSKRMEQVPVGMGNYYIESWRNGKIKLSKAFSFSGSFGPQNLVFEKYDKEKEYEFESYDDLNHLGAIPLSIKKKGDKIEIKRKINKTYMFFIKVREKGRRKKIAECLSAFNWSKILPLDIIPMNGILPLGVSGSNVVFNYDAQEHCKNLKTPFYFFRRPWSKNIKISNILKSVGFPTLNYVEPQEIFKLLVGKKELVTIVGLDSTSNNPMKYFSPFLSKTGAVFNKIDGLEELLVDASKSVSLSGKGMIMYKAHSLLLDSYYVFPIGQEVIRHYYSREISKLNWVEKNNDFINISSLEF